MRNIQIISDLQSQIARLKEHAAVEVREDLRALTQTADRLAERAAREAKELASDASLVVVETEISLRRAIQEAKARLKVIEAKDELRMAQNAIEADDLTGAEARVESASNLLEEARSLTANHVDAVTEVQQKAREILAAIRAKANTTKSDLDSLMERSDRLVRIMKESATEPSKNVA